MSAGGFAIWHPYLLHGSGPNETTGDRRTITNAYIKAEDTDRGEWAFKNGQPILLAEPVLIQYEEIFSRPEPHYINGAPNPFENA